MGIDEPVCIHELLETSAGASEALREQVDIFHAALDLFEARRWDDAVKVFNQVLELCPGDGPSLFFMNRCRQYLQYPPDRDWDGVFNITEK